jgi:hypothetical protein
VVAIKPAYCLPGIRFVFDEMVCADMDMISHCRAMAAFCRQHAKSENEESSFWIEEAEEWDSLIAEYSIRREQSVSTTQAVMGASAVTSDESSATVSHPR